MIREGHAYVDESGGKPVGDVFLRGSWRMEGRSVEGTQKNAGTASENDTAFKGRQKIEWPDVEKYLKEFVGEYYSIIETSDMIYIGSDLPDEFTGSNYTKKLKGALAKAKANAAQGLPELIEIASKKRFKENLKEKHDSDAKYGWYRYDTKFALPVYNENQELERFNVFQAVLLIRHAQDGKLYLYDLVNIKKETGKPLEQ